MVRLAAIDENITDCRFVTALERGGLASFLSIIISLSSVFRLVVCFYFIFISVPILSSVCVWRGALGVCEAVCELQAEEE